ncbi:hypothetical protein JQ543_23120 [Bradyrhizobium diazoefficiens]|nr:hypothetical protein [Bradyrhizobium diazoefficiens]MBR0850652.1 hypothetical protein [Bradyrhizobium diazoefficiens]
MSMLASPATMTVTLFGIVALVTLGMATYWLFNRRTRLRDIAALRQKLDELKPSDPQYGAVRALYTSMVVDAERLGFFPAEVPSGGHGGSADHGSSDHVSGHSH